MADRCYKCRKTLRSANRLFCKDCEGKKIVHGTPPLKVSLAPGVSSKSRAEGEYIEKAERAGDHVVRSPEGHLRRLSRK